MEQGSAARASANVEPAEGADPTGAITVTIGATRRVSAVRVSENATIRTPDGLAQTLAEAYSAALTAQLEASRRERPRRDPGQRPKPVATLPTFQRPTREQLSRHRIREESRNIPRATPGDAVGISSNECVTVTLIPAQPVGPVTADAGWLANASLDNLASAITEAFQNAYTERDK
ncbi:MAG: hypothetical protein H0X12_06440 [Nocardioides sp.]|nr:hypothetical protein [Nocardioides sp.]